MSFRILYTIASSGTLLAASTTPWFFTGLFRIDTVNINAFAPTAGITTEFKTVFQRDYNIKKEKDNGSYVYINDNSNRHYFFKFRNGNLTDFSLPFSATKTEYLDFDKKRIGISLFTNPAWTGTTKEDEYLTKLDGGQIGELFPEGLDESKVKQLLLSLSIRRRWKRTEDIANQTYWAYDESYKPESLNDLEDLKIKYFKEFQNLKNYVHKKVGMCIEEERACIANAEELGMIEQDKTDFHSGEYGDQSSLTYY